MLLPLQQRERPSHKTERCRMTKKRATGRNDRAILPLRRVKPVGSIRPSMELSAFQNFKSYQVFMCRVYYILSRGVGCRAQDLFVLSLLNLTQSWKFFLMHPFTPWQCCQTYGLYVCICLYPRLLRACAEPQAGVSPPRRRARLHLLSQCIMSDYTYSSIGIIFALRHNQHSHTINSIFYCSRNVPW